MGNTWITNMIHFLEEDGQVVPLPRTGINLVSHLGAIIRCATMAEWDFPFQTSVKCRRRPNRRPCEGFILATLNSSDWQIWWQCSHCGDRGVISGWEGTLWDVARPLA